MANYATTVMYCEKPDEYLIWIAEHFTEPVDVRHFYVDLYEHPDDGLSYDTRTDITNVSKMLDVYNTIRVEAQTPWTEDEKLIEILQYHCVRVYWQSFEEGNSYYKTNDTGARWFSNRFLLLTEDIQEEFIYEGDLVNRVKSLFPELACCETFDEIVECADSLDDDKWYNVMRIEYE